MSECEFEQYLDAYYDGQLTESRGHEVEAHVRTCAACSAALASMRRFSMAVSEMPRPELSAEASARFHEAARAGQDRMLVRWMSRVTGIAAAVVLAGSLWIAMTPADSSAANTPMPWEAVAANPRVETQPPASEVQLAEEIVAELTPSTLEQQQ